MKIENIRLLADRILILPDEPIKISKGGIWLPETVENKELVQEGIVCAVGPGRRIKATGKLIPTTLQITQRISFGKFSGQEIEIDYVEYVIMREDDVLAIVE